MKESTSALEAAAVSVSAVLSGVGWYAKQKWEAWKEKREREKQMLRDVYGRVFGTDELEEFDQVENTSVEDHLEARDRRFDNVEEEICAIRETQDRIAEELGIEVEEDERN